MVDGFGGIWGISSFFPNTVYEIGSTPYDFEDNWHHVLEVEGTMPPAEGAIYPLCVVGECNTPPEDVGGVAIFLTPREGPTRSSRNGQKERRFRRLSGSDQ